MKRPPNVPRHAVAGFTLIELLTVISIIAILAAASFAGYGRIISGVRKKESQVMAVTIANSVAQFFADYNRLPRSASSTAGSDTQTTTEGSEGVVMVLVGKEGEGEGLQNSRAINYLDGMKPAKAATKNKQAAAGASDKWVNGLVFEDDNYEIVDGWGNYYNILLDSNYDKEIENPSVDEVAAGRGRLPRQVVVWSAGADGNLDTWDDNPKSWD